MPIIQVKPAMIICDLRPDTSKPIASWASGAGNTICQQPGLQLRCDGGTKDSVRDFG
jgi:hypothetical protein